jgi:RNA polymerase sigma-70 factor (ECF subfamily)
MERLSRLKGLSDEELAVEAQAGSRHCFDELVSRCSRRLFLFLRPRLATDQDAEDLVQETFLKIYRNIHRFDAQYKFTTWVYTTASRLAISFYRKKKEDGPAVEFTGSAPGPRDLLMMKQDSENLWNTARNLHPNQFQALWLRYMEDLPLEEVAAVMNKSRVHVRVLLHRARSNLAKQLNPPALNGEDPKETAIAAQKGFSFL